jgi:hypothetical protein
MADPPVLITGRLLFDRPRLLPAECRIRVEVIDARWADAAHRVIAVAQIDRASLPEEVEVVPFHLSATLPASGPPCLVTAHVDVDGDGRVSRGDLITMESYPIEPSGDTFDRAVRVRAV